MGYDMNDTSFDQTLDLTNLLPYGDTMNDGMMQLSFTLPVCNDEKGMKAAITLSEQMGLSQVSVVEHTSLADNFTMYIVYGSLKKGVDYSKIVVKQTTKHVYTKEEIESLIQEKIKRPLVVVGASTGSDAHTVGIDAIMNMKGFAGHYGLERYAYIETFNLGSQVENEEFLKKALEVHADVLLISQTVTQKDVHIKNLVQFIELLEAENLREQFIVIIGGPRISHELAKELGFDAGFGQKKYAEHVATFFTDEYIKRNNL